MGGNRSPERSLVLPRAAQLDRTRKPSGHVPPKSGPLPPIPQLPLGGHQTDARLEPAWGARTGLMWCRCFVLPLLPGLLSAWKRRAPAPVEGQAFLCCQHSCSFWRAGL